MKPSIRRRLTFSYGVVTAATLATLGAATCALTHQFLMREVDTTLTMEYDDVVDLIRSSRSAATLADQLLRDYADEDRGLYEVQVVRTRDGSRLVATPGLDSAAWPAPKREGATEQPRELQTLGIAGHGAWRVRSGVEPSADGPLAVQVSAPLARVQSDIAAMIWALAVLVPIGLVLAVTTGYVMASRALAPVDALRQTADRISAQNLRERLPVPGNDELSRLARTLNGALERLAGALEEVRRFTADAAHELRTPVAVMRTQIEVAMQGERSQEAYQTLLHSLVDDLDAMGRMIDELLCLAREDAQVLSARPASVALEEVVRGVASKLRVLAESRGVTVHSTLTTVRVQGDPERLERAIANVVKNALQNTPTGGAVTLELKRSPEGATLLVTDTGTGIAPEHLPHVFERFYQADPARRQGGGTGLGLSICKSIIESHDGTVAIESQAGSGTQVTVSLPIQPD
jgi:heavy metal sensor kinase